ncbi:hypothetical protein F5B20DRAFT_583493 [Whalleya microplaca]|nr:hypothetical protein F5B20DRAFT_583493 [Whalleya microplaca]
MTFYTYDTTQWHDIAATGGRGYRHEETWQVETTARGDYVANFNGTRRRVNRPGSQFASLSFAFDPIFLKMDNIDFDNYKIPGTLTEGHLLTSTVTLPSGQTVTGTLDLDTVLGNANGALSWGGTGFSAGADNVVLTDGYTLEADLPDSTGAKTHSVLCLGAGVASHDGVDMMQWGFGVPHSTAHADAETNHEADRVVLEKVDTVGDDTKVAAVQTVHGDAAAYWPEGNAPAPGSHVVSRITVPAPVAAGYWLIRMFIMLL